VIISKKESKKKKTLIVFEGALISKKTDIGKFLNKIIFVHTPEKILAKRISERDGLSIKDALKLLKMQNNIKKNRKSADIVVLNDKSIKNLHKQLNLVLDKLAY
jgi:dephospho-CoA kinase